MKKVLKYIVTLVLPLAGLSALLGSCASTPCNNDACYDRSLSSVDPFEAGDIAEWGTEKEQKKKEQQRAPIHREFNR